MSGFSNSRLKAALNLNLRHQIYFGVSRKQTPFALGGTVQNAPLLQFSSYSKKPEISTFDIFCHRQIG